MVMADTMGEFTAPLLITVAGLAVGGLALWVNRRRTLRAQSPSLAEWQRSHGYAVDEWAAAVDGIVDGSAPGRERPDEALHEAIVACPDRRLRRELATVARAGTLACRRAAKGRAPGLDHRLYLSALGRAGDLIAAEDRRSISDAAPTEPPA